MTGLSLTGHISGYSSEEEELFWCSSIPHNPCTILKYQIAVFSNLFGFLWSYFMILCLIKKGLLDFTIDGLKVKPYSTI